MLVAVESLVLHPSTVETFPTHRKYVRVLCVGVMPAAAAAAGGDIFHGFDWRPKPICS